MQFSLGSAVERSYQRYVAGCTAQALGDHQRAQTLFQETLLLAPDRSSDLDDWSFLARANCALARLIVTDGGKLQHARRQATQAVIIARRHALGPELRTSEVLDVAIRYRLGEVGREEVMEKYERLQNSHFLDIEAEACLDIAAADIAKGDTGSAAEMLTHLLGFSAEIDMPLRRAEAHAALAELALGRGARDEALDHAELAFELAWCDGPTWSYAHARRRAQSVLDALGVRAPACASDGPRELE